jgi:hypothetical protein
MGLHGDVSALGTLFVAEVESDELRRLGTGLPAG